MNAKQRAKQDWLLVLFVASWLYTLMGCVGVRVTAPDPTQSGELIACINGQYPTPIEPEGGLPGVLGLVKQVVPGKENPQSSADIQGLLVGGLPLRERVVFESMGDIELLVGFSSDGQWLAYVTGNVKEGQTPSVHLLSAQGKIITQAPIPLLPPRGGTTIGAWSDARWISNEYLLVALHNPDPEKGYYRRHMLAILNPFTGEWHQEFLDQLSNRQKEFREAEVYFSPDMTRVVYVAHYESPYREDLVLWDLEHQRELWRRTSFNDDGVISGLLRFGNLNRAIGWSPDGARFFFTDTEAIKGESQYTSYILGRDGGQEQIVTAFAPQEAAVTDGVWSPDGRYIAYVNANSQIILYDPASDRTIQLCTGLEDPINLPGRPELMWSFDSRYLVCLPRIGGQPHLLTLNIQTGIVTQIMRVQTFFPAGWVANETWLNQ
jgi:WD40 repeat protein